MDDKRAGTGYLVLPDGDQGRGVLVLHSWWGLNDTVRGTCDRLAAAGFVALAPDLFGGWTTADVAEAEAHLAEAEPDTLAHVTRSSLWTLRELPVTPDEPLGVIGFSMGASMALWLSARVPEGVAATVAYYGLQRIDMAAAGGAFLGHFADVDPYVDEDDLALFDADLHLDGHDVEIHRYAQTRHWFAEPDRPEHDPEAAELAWSRTLAFLDAKLPR